MKHQHHRRHGGRIFKLAIFLVAAVIVFGFVVMELWNWLMPAIFGLATITYWQAWGLLILSWILFGVIRIGGQPRHWRHRMAERWMMMTPEEREKFRQTLHDRCHHHHDEEPPADKPAT